MTLKNRVFDLEIADEVDVFQGDFFKFALDEIAIFVAVSVGKVIVVDDDQRVENILNAVKKGNLLHTVEDFNLGNIAPSEVFLDK